MIRLMIALLLLSNSLGMRKNDKFLGQMTSNQFDSDSTKLFHNDPAFDKLEEINDNPLGAKILQTIGLQLQGGDSLAGISKLLNDLKGDLEAKQIEADTAHTLFQSQCKSNLGNYGQRITLAVNEINDSQFKVGRLEDDIGDYTAEIQEKSGQVKAFQDKDLSLRDIRSLQAVSFNSRSSQLNEMIQAFVVILPKLHELYDKANTSDSFIEEEAMAQALVQLSHSGGDNPIIALVSLTASLDPSSIQTIIEKMEVVKESLEASVQSDEEIELGAKRDSDTTLNEIFNAVETLQREKQSDKEALDECIRGRDIQSKRSMDAQAEFDTAKGGMKQHKTQCEEMLVQYSSNTQERQKEIGIIRDVQNIIATKINVVTAFIEENSEI